MEDADVDVHDAGIPQISNGPCEATEGSRIKFQGHRDEDGAWPILTPYDSELAAPCQLGSYAGADGTYCVPVGSNQVYFSDAACSTPFAVSFLDNVPTVASEVDFSSCRRTPTLYRGGAELSEKPSEAFYRNEANACVSIGVPPQSQARFFAATGPILASELVAFERESLGSLRITQDAFDGSDQSRLCGVAVDTELDFSCSFENTGASEVRCVPQKTAQTLFVDEECTTEIDTLLLGACPEASATHALLPSETLCQADGQVHTVATPILASYFNAFLDTCFPIGDAEVSRFGALEAAIASESLAKLRLEAEEGTGRLRRYSYQEEGGLSLLTSIYRDTTLDLDCRSQSVGEGARCLPVSSAPPNYFYSDSKCTIQFQAVEAPCLSEAPLFAFDGTTQEVVTLNSEPVSAYQMGDGGCELFPIQVVPTIGVRRSYTDFAAFDFVSL